MEEFLNIAVIFCMFQNLFFDLQAVKAAEVETQKIYLNSYAHCDHEKTFQVTLRQEYLILPDVSPQTGTNSFRSCEITFMSPDNDGHICLVQEGNPSRILDNNVELKVYDGLGSTDDVLIGHLKPYPDVWPTKDKCSTSRFITFFLSEIIKENSADIRKLQLNFRVVDIRSRMRTLYLDGTSCDSEYDLLDSRINLMNRPRFAGMTTRVITSECAMKFRKVEASRNSSICLAYVPLTSNVTCGSHWRFIVSSADFDPDERYIIYNLRCRDPKANKIHTWCADVKQLAVTVIFWRDSGIISNSSVEPPGEFKFVMTDYEGTEESLLEEIKASLVDDDDDPYLGDVEIILLSVGGALLVIVIAIGIWNRKKFFGYSAVEKRDISDGEEAQL